MSAWILGAVAALAAAPAADPAEGRPPPPQVVPKRATPEATPSKAAPPEATPSKAAPPEATPPLPTTYDPSRSLAPLVRAVEPAVVKVEVDALAGVNPATPHQWMPRIGEGSGFVISADGLVLTNHHVVEHASHIELEWSDGTIRPARLVGGDASMDVALLQVTVESPLTFVTLGDSDQVEVGDWVVAMGNGLGLGTTVTTGIVSGKGRVIGHDVYGQEAFLQTDAAINQGNSGGPLFDLDGKVIGMSAAIIAGANTVGFAIPSNLISSILDDLRATGKVARGFLGVQPQTLNAELRQALGIKARSGVVVTSVFEDTPAEASGLERGDVVLTIDGKPVAGDHELIATIGNKRPGDHVVLEVERDTVVRKVEVTLSERPSDGVTERESPEPPISRSKALGLALEPAPTELAAARGVQGGVYVSRVEKGSPTDGRLRSGDLIVRVDRHPVSSVADLDRYLAKADREVTLLVIREDGQEFVRLSPR